MRISFRVFRLDMILSLSLAMVGLAVASLPLTAPRAAQASEEIVGGVKVLANDPIEKSVVAVFSEADGSGALCSATLIAKDIALTAAHCVADGVEHMVVIPGTDIKADAASALRVVGAEVPSAWKKNAGAEVDLGDIAVIRFAGELPEGYKAAHIATKSVTLAKGDRVTLAGYGITRAGGEAGVGVLRKASVTIVEPTLGKTEMVLDQSDGSGACHGDSGGPAFIEANGKTYLLGVTNRSYPESAPDDCKHQVVYTKAQAYRAWITASVKKLRSAQ